MACIADLRQARGQHFGDFLEFGVQVLLVLQVAVRAAQRREAAGFIVLDREQRALRGVEQRLGMRQPRVLGVEFFPLVIARRQFVDFADLPLQALAFALQAVLGGNRMLQRLVRSAPDAPEIAQRLGLQAGVGVQQFARRVGAGEALPGVLAVDVEQLFAHGAQLRGSGRRAVDPGAAAALRIDHAAQQQAVFKREAALLQPGLEARRAFELGADIGLGRAFAHHAGIGARAQGELHGVDQNGFARAGLAGQRREAAMQVEVQRLDDDEVAQGDAFERHIS